MSIEVGAQYRFSFTVKDDTGALVNPTTKVVTVTLPNQTTATPSITTDSLGTFHSDYTMTVDGLHKFNITTTGPVTTRTDYVNAAQFRSVLGIDEARTYVGETDTSRDSILRQVMMSATERAESIVGVCVQRVFTNERIPGSTRAVLKMPHVPLPTDTSITSISSVFPNGPAWTTPDLIVYPDSGTVEPLSRIPFWWGPWKATYTAGRLVIPESVLLAVKEIIYDLWATQRPFGADSFEPGPEDTARWEQMLSSYELPPHAKALLEQEAQPGFA